MGLKQKRWTLLNWQCFSENSTAQRSGLTIAQNSLGVLMQTKSTPIDRFNDAVASLPASGGGGLHGKLLGAANHGVAAGLSDAEIFSALRSAAHGKRRVPDSEINAAIRQARLDVNPCPSDGDKGRGKVYAPPRQKPRVNGAKVMQKFRTMARERYDIYSEAELWELSPVRLHDAPEHDARLLLETLYTPDEYLFIGDRFDTQVKTASEWLNDEQLTGYPHIIPNPMTGEMGTTKSGTPSYRADSCVKFFRFVVVEFDGLSRADQIAFWLTADLPVSVIIDSGGKSLHGWVRVDVPDRQTWERDIEGKLFDMLVPVGADPMCRNEARLSRLPGHFRSENKRWQRILYLNPQGGAPCRM
jgi:hypothetical protein